MLEQWSYGHADHDPQSISWLVWGRSGISGPWRLDRRVAPLGKKAWP